MEGRKLRGMLFILLLAGLVLTLVLKKEDVERFDLDEAENKVDQVQEDVNKAMEEAQKKIDDALSDI